MPTTYQRCPAEVAKIGRRMMEDHYGDLIEVETKVAYLFARAQKDEHGKPLAPAVTVGGYPCAARARIIPLLQRADGRGDVEITIDEDEWDSLSEPERDSLIDHELLHFELQRDSETGAPKSDDLGRPKFKLKKHDVQVGWFDAIAKRHGDASYEVKQAKAFADERGQLYFGWNRPPESHIEDRPFKITPEVAKAAGKLASVLKEHGATVKMSMS